LRKSFLLMLDVTEQDMEFSWNRDHSRGGLLIFCG